MWIFILDGERDVGQKKITYKNQQNMDALQKS